MAGWLPWQVAPPLQARVWAWEAQPTAPQPVRGLPGSGRGLELPEQERVLEQPAGTSDKIFSHWRTARILQVLRKPRPCQPCCANQVRVSLLWGHEKMSECVWCCGRAYLLGEDRCRCGSYRRDLRGWGGADCRRAGRHAGRDGGAPVSPRLSHLLLQTQASVTTSNDTAAFVPPMQASNPFDPCLCSLRSAVLQAALGAVHGRYNCIAFNWTHGVHSCW